MGSGNRTRCRGPDGSRRNRDPSGSEAAIVGGSCGQPRRMGRSSRLSTTARCCTPGGPAHAIRRPLDGPLLARPGCRIAAGGRRAGSHLCGSRSRRPARTAARDLVPPIWRGTAPTWTRGIHQRRCARRRGRNHRIARQPAVNGCDSARRSGPFQVDRARRSPLHCTDAQRVCMASFGAAGKGNSGRSCP